MKEFEVLLAKSWESTASSQRVPSYARLVPHVRAVERAGESIIEIAGELILQQLELPLDPWLSRLRRALRVACLSHDLGKANEGFQKMVRGELHPTKQPARHELLSALLLEQTNNPVREWALSQLREDNRQDEAELLLECVIGAVGGHHVKLDEEWKKAALALRGGCGTSLCLLLTHPDLQSLFRKQIVEQEIKFSLVPDDPEFIGDRLTPFNVKSNRWRKQLKNDDEWWRFAAALKALLTAADVAGSAILPEAKKSSIRGWVHKTLCKRVTSEQMKEVVAARLKGRTLRPFQNCIGQSRARITLVEAGCGTGKTAAAYLWASHHAHGRKLFFCYPTTGTATEGFLGYVHETDVEAKLIHSRSIVDLEGIAEVKDDEENDHLLRIESLKAWSPRVVICTADTVLALVRNNRRGLYNSPAILSGAFVFDELHAYDDRMFEAVCALMKALRGTNFLLMSASLPKARKNFLYSQFSDIAEIPPPHDLENILRYKFQRLDDKDAVLKLAQEAVASGQKVLWICNTVSRAQRVLKDLNALGIAARTYHSRFKYVDRRRQHRKLIRWFKPHRRRIGLVAVTTQVAEMSLDLDADLLISEIAPIPALIQRLGRLNRHVTPKQPGSPRKAVFMMPVDENRRESTLPYDEYELALAQRWLDDLINLNRPLRQYDLAEHFNELSPSEPPRFNTLTRWLDYGWHTIPESVREPSVSVSIILPEDEKVCRQSKAEIIRRAVPMNFNSVMRGWREFKGNLIAPEGAIHYDKRTGAIWLKK